MPNKRSLSPTALAILTHLQKHADTQGRVSISMLDLGSHVGKHTSTISNAIQRLVDHGEIERIGTRRKTSKGVYRLTPENTTNQGVESVQSCSRNTPVSALPDVFRSSYFGDAGRLHQVAPKGEPLTQKQIIDLGIIRTRATLYKCMSRLVELPAPLASVYENPRRANGKLYEFHELTPESERINVAYLATVPGKAVKTKTEHEEENAAKRAGYLAWLGSEPDTQRLYQEQVKPFLMRSPEHPGCELFTGELNAAGYGVVRSGKARLPAHRVAWIAQRGELPQHEDLHHRCKVRNCATINHLAPMSKADHLALHRGVPTNVITPACWGRPQQPGEVGLAA